jgi:hypothetical protein
VTVTDLASAQKAIDTILEQGEGARGHWEDAHFGQFVQILDEYREMVAANPGFDPGAGARPARILPQRAGRVRGLARRLRRRRRRARPKAGHRAGGARGSFDGRPDRAAFAARHPDLAEGIVLVSGAVYQFSALLGFRDVLWFARRRPRETAAIAMEIATAGVPAPAAIRRLIVRSPALRRVFLSPYVLDPVALPGDAAALIVDGAGAPGVVPTARAIGRSDPGEGIDAVRCPILSLATEHDRIAPLPDTEALDRVHTAVQTVVLEGSGHMPMLERPAAFNAQLLRFAAGGLGVSEGVPVRPAVRSRRESAA